MSNSTSAFQMVVISLTTACAWCLPNECAAEFPFGPDTCIQGYVWREAFPGDRVCVTSQIRSEAAEDNAQSQARRQMARGPFGPDMCLQGFVWREASPVDHVCVSGQTRAQTALDNQEASSRRAASISVVTANTNGYAALNGVQWDARVDLLAKLVRAATRTPPDLISLTEFEGWRSCFPAWAAGDYDMADRLILKLRESTGATYRVAYMVGVRGAFGFLGRCQYYSGDLLIYNPARLINRTPAELKSFGLVPHDGRAGFQVRRSLPLCDRGTAHMALESLIDGSAQVEKCGKATPSGPAGAQVQGRVLTSMGRFAYTDDPDYSFDIFTLHPTDGFELVHAGPIVTFINAMSQLPFRPAQRYYPPIVVGDFNNLVSPVVSQKKFGDCGLLCQAEWPPDTTVAYVDPNEVMGVKFGKVGSYPAFYDVNPVYRASVPADCSQTFSDHCALFVRFERVPSTPPPPQTKPAYEPPNAWCGSKEQGPVLACSPGTSCKFKRERVCSGWFIFRSCDYVQTIDMFCQ